MKKRRIYHLVRSISVEPTPRTGELPAMPAHPPDDGSSRPKWNSKWDFDREGERVRIVVVAIGPAGEESVMDAREFIERLGEDHRKTSFAIHVETEQMGSPPLPHRSGSLLTAP